MSDLKASPTILPSHLFHYPYTLSAVIDGKNLEVLSERIPAGIYVSINVNSRRCWKSAIGVLLSDQSVVFGDTVTL
jgi:hypothetical protein